LGNILGMIDWAAKQQRWSDVISLGRAIDPYLTLHGLWEAWRMMIEEVLHSARQLGDRVNEAWALHQLGTHAIGIEQPSQAINFLRQALDLRGALGDVVGMAYTQHNLDLLIPPVSPIKDDREPPDKPNGKPSTSNGNLFKVMLRIIVVGTIVTFGLFQVVRYARASLFATATPTATPTATLTITPTPTLTPTATPTDTSVISQEPSITPTPSITETPDVYGPPAPIIVSPQNGSVLDCVYKTVTLAWNPVNDPSGINGYQVELYISYGRSPAELADQRNFSSSQTSWNIIIECDVSYGWKIMAQDGAGNWGAVSSGEFSTISRSVAPITPTFTLTPPDTTAPEISDIRVSDKEVNYPYPCGFLTTLTVHAIVNDDLSGVDYVLLHYGYNGDISLSMKMVPIDSITYQATIDVRSEADEYLFSKDGTLDLIIEAQDIAGNSNKADGGSVLVYYCAG
jgi:hypothetical protein